MNRRGLRVDPGPLGDGLDIIEDAVYGVGGVSLADSCEVDLLELVE